jgi:hypothetical protein
VRAIQIKLAATSRGRIVLHLWAMILDHKVAWHLAGIKREIA